MTDKTRDQLARWTKVLGILVALSVLMGATKAALEEHFVTQTEYRADQAKIDGKIDRVLDVVCEGKEQVRACQQRAK